MEIKRIQLRGISHSPSDRLTSDGGCSESLNVCLDNEELAPVTLPKNITDRITSEEIAPDFDIVFLHKVGAHEKYFLANEEIVGYYDDIDFVTLFQLDGAAIKDVTSVGNTIIFATSKGMRFVLYKDGSYKYLGDRIPEPKINVKTIPTEDALSTVIEVPIRDEYDKEILLFSPEEFNKAIKDERAGIQNNGVSSIRYVHDTLWAGINSFVKEQKSYGVMTSPFFVRYALRLYDGSYIYQSVPILLGAGYEKSFIIEPERYNDPLNVVKVPYFKVQFPNHFKAKAYIENWDLGEWSDLIESIDLFASVDVNYPVFNSKFSNIELESTTADGAYNLFKVEFAHEGTDREAVERELLNASTFYKIDSFKQEGIAELSMGYDITDSIFLTSQDQLLLQERLPDYEQSGIAISPSGLYSYNGRVIAFGGTRLIPTGYPFLQSTNIVDRLTTPEEYNFRYHISSDDGKSHAVLGRNENDTLDFTPYNATVKVQGVSGDYYARPYGLMFFPDSRCKKVEISIGEMRYSIPMKPHPYLNLAYAYWGLENTVDMEYVGSVQSLDTAEDRTIASDNRLYMSSSSNPFYYPVSGNKQMGATILGVAVANKALSEGQFGQFPLYVFTEDGIWAMEINSDGSFLSAHPLSREVCSSPQSITPIDQAVVFVTKKGLMLLQGSQVTCLSPFMTGKHDVINPSAVNIINGQHGFCDMVQSVMDTTPFMTFIQDAYIGYDYAGERLVCINPNESYQYSYSLATQTWHKISYSDFSIKKTINSYPSCEVAGVDVNGVPSLLDISTFKDDVDATTERAIIVTRPFSLGEPDVFKTIRDVRIRGQFPKGAVKFILLGSNDGISFVTLNTLRGKSWKLFRLVILADLAATDRISWVDIGYETRFTNRLR